VRERLRCTPKQIDPAFFEAAATVAATGALEERVWFLRLGQLAKQLPERDAQLVRERAIEAMDSGEQELVGVAVSILRAAVHRGEVGQDVRPRIREAARRATDLRSKRATFTLLSELGEDLHGELNADDPLTRLATVRAVGKPPSTEAQTVCLAIARDARLARDVRREAMHELTDVATKVEVCVELALAGDDQAAGSLRWIKSPAARVAAERLAVEGPTGEVRAIAAHVAKSLREIDARASRQP
jgi:hypothetical protein